ncbi:MAG TPA: nuclear transport factor 2 family protein [Solirubrobacteraceae bacterium]|nr:nuclear transport factor 2 family protein [Solirubrobacteraceae bacterium]
MADGWLMRWVGEYERAWRTPGTHVLGELFTPDVTYLPSPFEEPVRGLDALASFWDSERVGPGEAFTLRAWPVAVEGRSGVARAHVDYHGPRPRSYRDLWVVVIAADGRCRHFEEWPFHPARPRVAAPPA